jgi:hypothetical protein
LNKLIIGKRTLHGGNSPTNLARIFLPFTNSFKTSNLILFKVPWWIWKWINSRTTCHLERYWQKGVALITTRKIFHIHIVLKLVTSKLRVSVKLVRRRCNEMLLIFVRGDSFSEPTGLSQSKRKKNSWDWKLHKSWSVLDRNIIHVFAQKPHSVNNSTTIQWPESIRKGYSIAQ